MDKHFYITTTIPYVNADPHIGFVMELIQADAIARYKRLLGREVFFSTGTDEYGQKIAQAAAKNGQSAQNYVDHYAERFAGLKEILNLSTDNFIRTTSDKHKEAAQEFWRLCDASGDIYKKAYRGLYCVGCEKFLRTEDVVNGVCLLHPNQKPEEIEEENYFFRLSNYAHKLIAYLNSSDVVLPDWRKKEALEFVENGLEDFSISRPHARLSWGIPVPNDPDHVMYVWFGAFVNYISTLGWPHTKENFDRFWQSGETVQLAGKDMVRFQSIMWQAMLLSAGFKTTSSIMYHGFIISGGQKMSKSLGNVTDPFALVAQYGTDALRYFLLREITTFEDGDFTPERFKEAYNANLANGIGNLAARVMKMAETYLEEIPSIPDINNLNILSGEGKKVAQHMEAFELNKAMNIIWYTTQYLDVLIQEQEAFKEVKKNPIQAKKRIQYYVKYLTDIALLLQPFMPQTSFKIIESIKQNKKPENLFTRKA